MITKFVLQETNSFLNDIVLCIDFVNRDIKYFINDIQLENTHNDNIDRLIDIINAYVTYWDNQYVDDSVIDGNSASITIYTNDEVLKYIFKNKFPYNYGPFISELKEVIGIYE